MVVLLVLFTFSLHSVRNSSVSSGCDLISLRADLSTYEQKPWEMLLPYCNMRTWFRSLVRRKYQFGAA